MGLRLALQTVGLLLVMLIVLEGVVFVITQHTLLGSLESTLKNRAHQVDPNVCHALELGCAQGSPGPTHPGTGPGGQPQGRTGGDHVPPHNGSSGPQYTISTNPNEASAVYVDTHGSVFHADGNHAARLLYLPDAEKALATHKAQCCTAHGYDGQEYLAYTEPIPAGGKIVGAVQTNISEHQYQSTLQNLIQALLIVGLLGLLICGDWRCSDPAGIAADSLGSAAPARLCGRCGARAQDSARHHADGGGNRHGRPLHG